MLTTFPVRCIDPFCATIVGELAIFHVLFDEALSAPEYEALTGWAPFAPSVICDPAPKALFWPAFAMELNFKFPLDRAKSPVKVFMPFNVIKLPSFAVAVNACEPLITPENIKLL